MKNEVFACIYILAFFFIGGGELRAQSNKPVNPMIKYVSVDTATNYVNISWEKSSSSHISRYNIYQMVKRGNPYEEGDSIGFVLPNISVFTDSSALAGNKSVHYSVVAIDSSEFKSDLSPTHGTIYTKVTYDSCANTLTLNWNKYLGWEDQYNGGVYVHGRWGTTDTTVAIDPTFNSIYVFERVQENIAYSFFIEGLNSHDGYISLSNIAEKYTSMPLPPDDLHLNYVTVTGSYTVDLNFSFTGPSPITSFAVLRSNKEFSEFSRIKTFQNISSTQNTIQDSIFTSVNRYFYKIGALNTCQSLIGSSNLGTNLLLLGQDTVINSKHFNFLSWNKYIDFPLDISGYELFRISSEGDTILITTISSTDTSYTYNTSEIYELNNAVQVGQLVYFIKAIENGSNQSYSNLCVVKVKSEVWMPNAFTPNGDGINDLFAPKLNFIPREYLMIIYDRAGIQVFSSDNPDIGWDGRVNSGKVAPEGVYIYYVWFTSYNGQKQNTTGSVTVFYPR